jgi:hypothetical protein
LQSNAQVAQELKITKQEIDDEGGVDLGQHGVFRVADEGLDLQVLLDEAEEDLDLPAFLVDVGDGLGRQLKMVGEKDVALAGGGVPVGDAAQGNETFQGFGASQPDGLVGEQPLAFIYFMVLQHLVAGVALLSGDEEDFLGGELRIPGIVGIDRSSTTMEPFGRLRLRAFLISGSRAGETATKAGR